MSLKYTTDEYIAKIRGQYGDVYDYSKTIYTGTSNKLIVTCKLHGDFPITANSHSNGNGCYYCGLEKITGRKKSTNGGKGTKACASCGIDKALSEFSPGKRYLYGVRSCCKVCAAIKQAKYKLLKKPLPIYKTHKICCKCHECLPVENFSGTKRKNSMCKNCKNAYDILPQQKELVRKYKLQNIKRSKELATIAFQKPAASEPFIKKLLLEDKPENRDGLLFVACKKCGKMFNPTTRQARHRAQAVTHPGGTERNFYCSEHCKDTCDVFNRKKIRKSEVDHAKNKARSCQSIIKKELIKLQCDTNGYNFCEKCGEVIGIELHHTKMVQYKEDENNPAGFLLLCIRCHKEIHADCR